MGASSKFFKALMSGGRRGGGERSNSEKAGSDKTISESAPSERSHQSDKDDSVRQQTVSQQSSLYYSLVCPSLFCLRYLAQAGRFFVGGREGCGRWVLKREREKCISWAFRCCHGWQRKTSHERSQEKGHKRWTLWKQHGGIDNNNSNNNELLLRDLHGDDQSITNYSQEFKLEQRQQMLDELSIDLNAVSSSTSSHALVVVADWAALRIQTVFRAFLVRNFRSLSLRFLLPCEICLHDDERSIMLHLFSFRYQ